MATTIKKHQKKVWSGQVARDTIWYLLYSAEGKKKRLLGRADKSVFGQQSGYHLCQKLVVTWLMRDECAANVSLLPVLFSFGIRRFWYPKPASYVISFIGLWHPHTPPYHCCSPGDSRTLFYQVKGLLQIDTKVLQGGASKHLLHQERREVTCPSYFSSLSSVTCQILYLKPG